jgi:hypothetical protein
MPPMNDDHFKRGIIFASKLAAREEREKERKKNREKSARDNLRKEAQQRRYKFMASLELFTLGVIAYPFVAPAYNLLIKLAGG